MTVQGTEAVFSTVDVSNGFAKEQLPIAIFLYVHLCNQRIDQALFQHANCRLVNKCGTSLEHPSTLYVAFRALWWCLSSTWCSSSLCFMVLIYHIHPPCVTQYTHLAQTCPFCATLYSSNTDIPIV